MAHPSTAATVVFLLTVAGVAMLWMLAAARVRTAGRWLVAVLVLAATLLVPALLARAGALDRYNPLPAPGLILVLVISVGTVALALSPFGARLASAVPLAALVGYQAFRIPVEWTLHRLYLDGVVPVQMTYAGWNFDVVSGATALLVGLVIASGRPARGLVLAWNLLGLALLANIVTIAVLSTPVPFRAFTNDPVNLLPSTFPFVWLPTFLVQAALFGHILVFRALRVRDGR